MYYVAYLKLNFNDKKAAPGTLGRKLYDEGVRFGCWGMAMYSLSCSCYSFIIEKLIKKLRYKLTSAIYLIFQLKKVSIKPTFVMPRKMLSLHLIPGQNLFMLVDNLFIVSEWFWWHGQEQNGECFCFPGLLVLCKDQSIEKCLNC